MGHARREATNEYAALFVALIGVPSHPPPAASVALYTARIRHCAAVMDALCVQCGSVTRLLRCAGESDSPQGVVNTSDGRVVRAFHRFTLVDQSAQGRDLMKGRSRAQGAVKISCARQVPHWLSHETVSVSSHRVTSLYQAHCLTSALQWQTDMFIKVDSQKAVALQDPNARNCHGYRKFVKRSVLENLNNGYLVNDTIVIKYTIELVVSTGGALTRQAGPSTPKLPLIQVRSSSRVVFLQDLQSGLLHVKADIQHHAIPVCLPSLL